MKTTKTTMPFLSMIVLLGLAGCVDDQPQPEPPAQTKRNPRNAPWDKYNVRNARWDYSKNIYRFPYKDLNFNKNIPESQDHPITPEEIQYTNEMREMNGGGF
jgi:hypothetical protein